MQVPNQVQTIKNIDPTLDALLVPGIALSTVGATLYTAEKTTIVEWYEFNNTDKVNPHTVTVHAIPSGATASVATHVMDFVLSAGESSPRQSAEVLLSGYTLQITADLANVVRVSVSGRIQNI